MDAQKPKSSRQLTELQTVMVRPFLLKPQWMNGLSERLLVSHYENNYGGDIPARAYNALPVILIEGNSVKSEIVETSKINIGKKKTCR